MDKKSVPVGVKIIGVLFFIVAFFHIIFGIFIFISDFFSLHGYEAILIFFILASIVSVDLINIVNMFIMKFGDVVSPGLLIFIVIIFIVLGVLGVFVGWGLFKAKPWARMTVIILIGLGVILTTIFIFTGIGGNILNILINLAIGLYLLLNNDVKKAFS
jgi:hypothetical protein